MCRRCGARPSIRRSWKISPRISSRTVSKIAILVRRAEERKDNARYVLVEGLHRLEACRLLGEKTVSALIVHARRR